VVYAGCVGDDDLAEQLKAANKREGLREVYQVKKGEKTGACAVVITGHHRSLVTTLRVAEKFEKSHLESEVVAPLVEGAKVFYVEGYFLTHGTETSSTSARRHRPHRRSLQSTSPPPSSRNSSAASCSRSSRTATLSSATRLKPRHGRLRTDCRSLRTSPPLPRPSQSYPSPTRRAPGLL